MGHLPDPKGFPLRALMAVIAEAESGGDPDTWVAHDPPDDPRAEPSSGLFQVHRPDWPLIYSRTEAIRLSPISDEEKIHLMTEAARPVMADMLASALRATRTLQGRGFAVDVLTTALFVDAAWQSGGPHLEAWATRTSTGDAREIVNPKRTVAIEVALRNLAHEALGTSPALSVFVGVAGAFLFGGLILWNLK